MIQTNKVIITISSDDISALNTTALVRYIDNELSDTDIRIMDPNMETTQIFDGMSNSTDDEILIIIYAIVVITALVLVIAGILSYRQKQRIKHANTDERAKNYDFVMQSSPQTVTNSPHSPQISLSSMKLSDRTVSPKVTSQLSATQEKGESDDGIDDMFGEENSNANVTPNGSSRTSHGSIGTMGVYMG